MKRLTLYSFLLCLSAHQAFSAEPYRKGPYLTTREQYQIFKGKYDVVMFGDSLTERGKWQDMFPAIKIGNRGISGDDTAGMISRVDDVISTQAKTVYIMAGTNDVSERVPPEESFNNLKVIYKKLTPHGIKVIFQSTIYGDSKRVEKNRELKELNDSMLRWCKSNGISYIDLNASLSPDGYLLNEYTIDGIHLNIDGYKIWNKIIAKSLPSE